VEVAHSLLVLFFYATPRAIRPTVKFITPMRIVHGSATSHPTALLSANRSQTPSCLFGHALSYSRPSYSYTHISSLRHSSSISDRGFSTVARANSPKDVAMSSSPSPVYTPPEGTACLFVYGTLMCPQILQLLLNRCADPLHDLWREERIILDASQSSFTFHRGGGERRRPPRSVLCAASSIRILILLFHSLLTTSPHPTPRVPTMLDATLEGYRRYGLRDRMYPGARINEGRGNVITSFSIAAL
jgi:hypothetical protein